jgi:hypothetical protein
MMKRNLQGVTRVDIQTNFGFIYFRNRVSKFTICDVLREKDTLVVKQKCH